MTAQPIVFLDTETTSLYPSRKIWEVAMIKRDEHGERETHFFIDNIDLSAADPYSLKVGRYYDRHPSCNEGLVKGAALLSKPAASHRVEKWTRGATIVGLVPSFDTEGLDRQLRAVGCMPAWDYHLVDVRGLALGWLLGCGWPVPLNVKTDQLAELCGVQPANDDARHTALGDARWARDWYDHLTNLDSEGPNEDLLDELYGHVDSDAEAEAGDRS